MAAYMGRKASIKVGTELVSNMMNWNIDIKADVIREDVFGTEWAKKWGLVATDWSATAEGLLDLEDTTGQDIMYDAMVSGTLIDNVRFYVDDTTYYVPDTTADPDAGVWITSFSPKTAQGEVAKVSISIEGSGPILKTTV